MPLSPFTYAGFINGLAAISVTGVTRTYGYPPVQIATADLPCMYPRLPDTESGNATLGHVAGLKTAIAELVVVVEVEQQSTSEDKFDLVLTLLDNLNTALINNVSALNIDNWEIRNEYTDTGDWILVAEVRGSG